MITASQVAPLRRASVDYNETEELKAKFARLRAERHPFFLKATEFDDILKWKLRGQYNRQRSWRAANTVDTIRAVTGLALTITHDIKDYELELRVSILCALRGVGVPVASAVLALVFPNEYAVIDFRGWRQVFGKRRSAFSVPDYKRYMQKMRLLARELGWAVQEVDLAIWEYDRRHGAGNA